MASRTASVLRVAACVLNILYASVACVFVVEFVLPWEGGPQFAAIVLSFTWGYALANLGAVLSKSRRWRIVWAVPAGLGNVGYLIFAFTLLGDLADPISAVHCACLLILVVLNSTTIIVTFRSPRGRSD